MTIHDWWSETATIVQNWWSEIATIAQDVMACLAAKTIHDWAEIATIAQGATAIVAVIAAVAAACLVYRQIKSAHEDNTNQIEAQREENRKWKTLDICAQYEFSETICCAVKNIQLAFDGNKELTDEMCCKVYRDAKVVLNYLDGIAIGVGQGLYIEGLARDHLKQIVKFHVDRLLHNDNCNRLRLNPNDYQFVTDMHKQWDKDQNYRDLALSYKI